MKKYGDLNLKKIRDDNGLDFAHFTYASNMCSCCSGPTDFAKKYWKGGIVLEDNYTFILFKNANNGSGIRKKTDFIEDGTCIEYNVKDDEQMKSICIDLQRQLGVEYVVVIPKDAYSCIELKYVKIES